LAKTLYVGNLPYSATESSLVDAFAAHGARNARIVEGRGFGFVDIDDDQLEAAISAMNGREMGGRTLTVNEARPREDRGSGGSRSSSNYGGGGGRGGSRRW
jgi:RNA recognition motif-containing protein